MLARPRDGGDGEGLDRGGSGAVQLGEGADWRDQEGEGFKEDLSRCVSLLFLTCIDI